MKRQDKSSGKVRFSAPVIRDLRAAYRELDRLISQHPWLVQGSVNEIIPSSPSAKVTYTWTRKVRAKTTTIALSQKQANVFREAIAANRRIEEVLNRLRQVSQSALLEEVPGVTKRRLRAASNGGAESVPNGA